MLRSCCSGDDPVIAGYYSELCEIVRSQGPNNQALLAQMMPQEGDNDENRPKAFYQATGCNRL